MLFDGFMCQLSPSSINHNLTKQDEAHEQTLLIACSSVLAWQSMTYAHSLKDGAQDSCVIEVAYQMTEGLASRMKESVATSLVHSVGQRVFLHNSDCKGNPHCSIKSIR